MLTRRFDPDLAVVVLGCDPLDQGQVQDGRGLAVPDAPALGLNFRMTEIQGAVLVAQLRKLDRIREHFNVLPIIVVSGLAGRHLALKEPVAVFDKPIDPDEFGVAVDRALGVEVEE